MVGITSTSGHRSAGLRAVLAALAANLGIAATKFAAFAITGSASMLAESVHSVADTANQALLLLGRNRAARAQTEEHPFGRMRSRRGSTRPSGGSGRRCRSPR